MENIGFDDRSLRSREGVVAFGGLDLVPLDWCGVGDCGVSSFPCLISIFLLVVLLAWCGVGNLVLLGWLGVGNTSVGLISSPVFVILPGSRCKEKTANSKVECPLVLQVGAIVLQPSCLS